MYCNKAIKPKIIGGSYWSHQNRTQTRQTVKIAKFPTDYSPTSTFQQIHLPRRVTCFACFLKNVYDEKGSSAFSQEERAGGNTCQEKLRLTCYSQQCYRYYCKGYRARGEGTDIFKLFLAIHSPNCTVSAITFICRIFLASPPCSSSASWA